MTDKDKYDELYRQCDLTKIKLSRTCGGVACWVNTTSWIPNKHARVGLTVKLKKEDGTWDSGWQIKLASSITKAQEDLEDHEKISINLGKPTDT